jgi:hypothetical protein
LRSAQGRLCRLGVKKNLDRILKPGKLSGNVGNYEDETELISISPSEEHPAVVVAGDSRGVACSTGNKYSKGSWATPKARGLFSF